LVSREECAVKVRVSRSGGFAGVTREWEADVDDGLVDNLPWDAAPFSSGSPDRFVYVIYVSHRQITLPEKELTGPWRELVDRVTKG
jgi:hypothetical protein